MERLKHRLTGIVRNNPILIELLGYAYRATRPRFTAGVVAVIFNEDRQLLVVEHVWHARYPWGLPGGWLDAGENPADGVQRECYEELNLRVKVERPLLVERRFYRKHLDIAFLCHAAETAVTISPELLSFRWVNPEVDQLPPLKSFQLKAIQAARTESSAGVSQR